MARPVYDDAFKAEAIALAVEHGPAEAARTLGNVKAGTIRSWCSLAGVTTVANETTRAAVETIKLTHEARRAALADKLLGIAEKAVDVELGMLTDSRLHDVVGARTRAIHDHQLLIGGATARTEHAPVDAAVEAFDELAGRRASKAA